MKRTSAPPPSKRTASAVPFPCGLIIDSVPLAILILNDQLLIGYANSEASALFGYNNDDLIGRPSLVLVPDRLREKHLQHMRQYMEAPTKKTMGSNTLTLARHRDGHEVPVEVDLGPMTYGGQDLIVLMIRDISQRVADERRIRLADRQVRVITDALPVLIAQLDQEGRFCFVNAEFERAFGKDREWFLGRASEDLLSERVHQKALADLSASTQQHHSTIEVEVEFPEIGRRTLHVEVIRELLDNGRMDGYYALASDITERRQFEATLGLHSQVLDQVHEAIVSTDLAGRVTSWNRGAQKIFDYTEDEAKGRHISFVYADDDRPYLKETIVAPLMAKGAYEANVRMVRRDGEIFDANMALSLLRDASGQAIGMIGYLADISDRKRAEAALAENNLRLTRILESISDAFYALDKDWKFTYLNSKALNMAGRPIAEILGQQIWSVFPNIVGTHLETTFRSVRTDGAPIKLERYYPELDRWYELRVYPTNGGISVFSNDITERKHYERELAIRLSQQAAVAELGELAISEIPFRNLADRATAHLAETLEVEYTKVLELLPGGEELVLLAGTGWSKGYVGRTRIPADVRTQAGYTLKTLNPVIVTDFETETRFGFPDLLKNNDVVSGMSVAIMNPEGAYGVLEAHTTRKRVFTNDDVRFLESIANILAEAHRARTLLSELQKSNEQLGLLSKRLAHAQETERKRIAHELHDQIGQSLTAVKFSLHALEKAIPEARAVRPFTESIGVIDQALERVRSLCFDLRPSVLDDLGLVPALRWYLDRQAEIGGFRVKFTAAPSDIVLDPFLETNCFRIVQETVTNILRHAQAELVEVELCAMGEVAELRIRDNGVGFDVPEAFERAQEGKSLGLLGLRERALLMQGDLSINSDTGQGAEIVLTFPILE